jgi:peptidoglycan/xylan/chitin deacetylase (PgdA/CDA1 family)
MNLERGVFTLSLDLELIWGTLDLLGPDVFRERCKIERAFVIDRLLDLFVEFEIRATWCVVGHLLLDRCYGDNGRKHPEIVRPQHAWCRGDWFQHDPDGTEVEAPEFLGRSLVEKIRRCPVPQEIGSHSFSHVIFGDAGCSRETARAEIEACIKLGTRMGLSMHSFSFPRNQIGHSEILAEYGFACFRGLEPSWYRRPGVPTAIQRLAHLLENVTVARPPVVLPRRTLEGLVEIPGSMVYFPAHGLRRLIPVSWRVRRALKGLNAAVRQNRIFHLWMHPTNLADETEALFEGLRQILEHVSRCRDRGAIDVMPMVALAAVAAGATDRGLE